MSSLFTIRTIILNSLINFHSVSKLKSLPKRLFNFDIFVIKNVEKTYIIMRSII